MSREIKFRAWDKEEKKMIDWVMWHDIWDGYERSNLDSYVNNSNFISMQYTGLKDKNGLTEVYESDIIDIDGNIIGNIYQNNELLKETTNLTIQDFGGKTWCSTYKEAMDRGCKHS